MNDLLDTLLEELGGKQYENYLACICPFHSDHKPSLMVYEDFYRCLACDASGTTKSLLDKIKGVPSKPKLSSWHNPFTSWLRNESLNNVMKTGWRWLKDNSCYGNYLKKRGIPSDIQIELGIGWRDGWFLFPIINEKRKLVGAVARCGEGLDLASKYIIPSGQNPNLLYVPDWELVKNHTQIYLTFGIIDSITITLYNAPGMSTTTGKRLNPEALDQFRKRIIFLPDMGEEKEALTAVSKLGWRGAVPKMEWPDGCKDINDLHQFHPEILHLTFKDYKNGNDK